VQAPDAQAVDGRRPVFLLTGRQSSLSLSSPAAVATPWKRSLKGMREPRAFAVRPKMPAPPATTTTATEAATSLRAPAPFYSSRMHDDLAGNPSITCQAVPRIKESYCLLHCTHTHTHTILENIKEHFGLLDIGEFTLPRLDQWTFI